MTVYDFMLKMGKFEKFNIVMFGKKITDKKVHLREIEEDEELFCLYDALERPLVKYETIDDTLYC